MHVMTRTDEQVVCPLYKVEAERVGNLYKCTINFDGKCIREVEVDFPL